ncbi:hypothetical protein BG015_012063 [Linnemannia schmuckeri]|uniref:gamma-glutamylcyclotransferase n=1 Tax=Linnemannia schmuckeri TaxID=64567 RepID=A0A9P5V7X5_9FUNG|nr:hypothetical protein BG015_012063 [Linnemannia schmuckeri]
MALQQQQQQQERPQLAQRRTTNSSSSSISSTASSTNSSTTTITTPSSSSTNVTTLNDTPSSEETIWYLAYGSNMDPRILTDSRKIIPLETKRVRVPDYWLSFDLGGIPFSEPCFASILKKEPERMREKEYAMKVHAHCRFGQAFVWKESEEEGGEGAYPMDLHGVVYRITLRDWELIVHSEGGWGHDVPIGYDMIHVSCEVYNTSPPQQISARVLLARPKSIKPNCQPSLRYKNLLTTGARYHNLPPAYQDSLARVVPYTCQGPAAIRAKRLFRVFNLPLEWTFAAIVGLNRGKEGREEQKQPPYWMAWLFDKTYRFASWAHDWVLLPVVGVSGRCLEDGEMRRLREGIEKELVEEEEKRRQANVTNVEVLEE